MNNTNNTNNIFLRNNELSKYRTISNNLHEYINQTTTGENMNFETYKLIYNTNNYNKYLEYISSIPQKKKKIKILIGLRNYLKYYGGHLMDRRIKNYIEHIFNYNNYNLLFFNSKGDGNCFYNSLYIFLKITENPIIQEFSNPSQIKDKYIDRFRTNYNGTNKQIILNTMLNEHNPDVNYPIECILTEYNILIITISLQMLLTNGNMSSFINNNITSNNKNILNHFSKIPIQFDNRKFIMKYLKKHGNFDNIRDIILLIQYEENRHFNLLIPYDENNNTSVDIRKEYFEFILNLK